MNLRAQKCTLNSRWLGSESDHWFSAESSSATMCCSHCWLHCSSCALDLLVEYCGTDVSFTFKNSEESTHDCSHGKGQYLAQTEHVDECGHLGWLTRGLLEQRLSLWRQPVLVIALGRQREIETRESSAMRPRMQQVTDSLLVVNGARSSKTIRRHPFK